MTTIKLERMTGLLLLVVAGVAILVAIGGSTIGDALRYDREEILAGQVWRILTAHLVHLGWSHLLLNLIGLVFIWALFGQALSTRGWVGTFVVCALGVSLGLLAFNPRLGWYVGLSGILHGLFAAGAIAERHIHRRTYLIMLGLLLSKLMWEQFHGPLPGTASTAGGNVIVDAHLYGAITGLVVGWVLSHVPKRSQ